MSRNLSILLIICFLLLVSCTTTTDDSNGNGEGQQGTSEIDGTDGTSGAIDDGSSNIIPDPTNPAEDAQSAMRSGDMETAIAILESMTLNIPPDELTSRMLIDAHLGYAFQISASGYTDLEAVNLVQFHHYVRVLNLDPDNSEALAGVTTAGAWLADRGIEPPVEIDPLIFLPVTDVEESADSDENTDAEAEESTDDGEESVEAEEE